MSPFEWTIAGITVLGFLLTIAGVIVAVTRSVAGLATDLTGKLARERENTLALVATIRAEISLARDELFSHFNKGQISQDHNVGELGLSLRRYVEGVEKEMHRIEIWGRDNYVQKGELEGLRKDLKTLVAEIKVDIKELGNKLDSSKNRNASA